MNGTHFRGTGIDGKGRNKFGELLCKFRERRAKLDVIIEDFPQPGEFSEKDYKSSYGILHSTNENLFTGISVFCYCEHSKGNVVFKTLRNTPFNWKTESTFDLMHVWTNPSNGHIMGMIKGVIPGRGSCIYVPCN